MLFLVAQTSKSAVSRISNPRNSSTVSGLADWKSAIQQVGNLRYKDEARARYDQGLISKRMRV
jgi:hypothetical protein